METIHKRLFVILCDIDDFCRENKITYFLSGGTCLGAARHSGFIPWDDDIDIMMPRKDYERFIEIFSESIYSSKYKVGDISTDEKWVRTYARIFDLHSRVESKLINEPVMGIFIDIFPIDPLPVKEKIPGFYRKVKFLDVLRTTSMRGIYVENEKFVFLKKLLGVYSKIKGARYYAKKIIEHSKSVSDPMSEYVGVSCIPHYGDKEAIKRECMDSSVYLKFESRDFPVPVGYETYLSNLYGNWKKIPKDAAEKGYTHLNFWKVEVFD